MPQSEQLDLVGNVQKGGQSGHQTYDVLLLQQLSFESALITFTPEIIKDFHASGCFDRIIKALAVIMVRRLEVTKEEISRSCFVKCDVNCYVKLSHGIS